MEIEREREPLPLGQAATPPATSFGQKSASPFGHQAEPPPPFSMPYMNKQKDINAKMRAILVDWIVEVHYMWEKHFKLHQSTLWLIVNIIDRYLENVQTVRSDLQLVGVTSLFIACKFEEVYPPEVKDCVYITDNAYSREQILGMEFKILKQLDYNICVPTGFHFMTRYLHSFEVSEQVKYLSFYYAERNLQEYDMLSFPPNKFAAFALYAALSFHLPDDYDPRPYGCQG